MKQTVHIIGRGIAGLALGFELATRGIKVILHGPSQCAGSATSAAVGVCSVKGNFEASTPLFAAKIAAQSELLPWLQRIEKFAGATIPKLQGLIEPFFDLQGYETIRERVFHKKFTGCNRSFLINSSKLKSYLQGARGAFSFPADFWFDPLVALNTLEAALTQLGAQFQPDLVHQIVDHPDKGLILVKENGVVFAEQLVLAAGIFSNTILLRSGINDLQQAAVEGETVFGARHPSADNAVVNFRKINFVAHDTFLAFGSTSRPKKSIDLCSLDLSAAEHLRIDCAKYFPSYSLSQVRWGIRGRFRHQSPICCFVSTPSQIRRFLFLSGFHKSGLQLAHYMAKQAVDKLLIARS